jgi:3-oxoacyl-[acyl-carrier protein] reductase
MTRELPDEARAKIIAGIPMGRLGAAADVAGVALFLAGPGAAYVTGETIRVDGGMAT